MVFVAGRWEIYIWFKESDSNFGEVFLSEGDIFLEYDLFWLKEFCGIM